MDMWIQADSYVNAVAWPPVIIIFDDDAISDNYGLSGPFPFLPIWYIVPA